MKYQHSWEYIQKPREYVIKGEVINVFRPKLNGDHRRCPRCGHLLFRDFNDLFCLRCAWRESGYFRQSKRENVLDLVVRFFITNNTRYINALPEEYTVIR